jgi:hypothetical protein
MRHLSVIVIILAAFQAASPSTNNPREPLFTDRRWIFEYIHRALDAAIKMPVKEK